jgi:tRNA-dihydrouridine synthase
MIGRGVIGRPWLAAAVEADLTGRRAPQPDADERLGVVLDHLAASIRFHGDRLGVRTFRKHLAAYIDATAEDGVCGSWSEDERRDARRRLCRLETPGDIAGALEALWKTSGQRLAA